MQVSPTMTDATVHGPEPFELLRRLELLRSLDDSTLKALMEGVEPVKLQEGQVLVRQGELDDALYAVAWGTLRAVTVPSAGEEKILEGYGPGGVLGEIQLVLGGAWTTTIEAESTCLLYRLKRAVLDALSDRPDSLLEPLVGLIRQRMGRAQLAEVFPTFLGPLSPRELHELEKKVQWVTVRRGEALFRQGDPVDGWYIVMSGRLKILRRDEFGDLKSMWEVLDNGNVPRVRDWFAPKLDAARVKLQDRFLMLKRHQQTRPRDGAVGQTPCPAADRVPDRDGGVWGK